MARRYFHRLEPRELQLAHPGLSRVDAGTDEAVKEVCVEVGEGWDLRAVPVVADPVSMSS
jgi:hypothetical protein